MTEPPPTPREHDGELRIFTSTASREGRRWFVQCDQHPHVVSKTMLLVQAAEHQRFGIASYLDIPPGQVTVDVQPVLPAEVDQRVARARELRETAAWANKTAATETRAAARILAELGLSLRDIGTIFGVSFQRAHQLVTAGMAAGGDRDER